MQLEIAVVDLQGVAVAVGEAADRIELCTSLEVGGLTPSEELLSQALERAGSGVGVHPLIRPRPGDFVYTDDEVNLLVMQASRAVRLGARGLIFGALTEGGEIDGDTLARISDSARAINPETELTFHRAFDKTACTRSAMEDLIGHRLDRVMSAGNASGAGVNLEGVRVLVNDSGRRLQVMAGGGLRIGDIGALRSAGVDAVHFSARKGTHPRTDRDLVRAARQAITG